ncbi:MAG: DUF4412 domain-containing protein [Flavobacteriales bacterium]|nr:DUF4412 domain-containing protein [Flavobacteriales bacterium]
MKKLITLLFLGLFATLVNAQDNFEGKIKYEMEYSGEDIEGLVSMMPAAYVYEFSEYGFKFTVEGGMMAMMMGTMMTNAEEEVLYILKENEKMAYKIDTSEDEEDDSEDDMEEIPVIVKEDEVLEIAGYECQKYSLTSKEQQLNDAGVMEEVETTVYVWVTDELSVGTDVDGEEISMGNIFLQGVKGFPLKVETTMIMGEGKTVMIQTAVLVEEKKYSKSDFEVPSDYTVEETTIEKMFSY